MSSDNAEKLSKKSSTKSWHNQTAHKKQHAAELSLHPLTDFVDDPRQLIEQSFQAIEREELITMLPVILQTISENELKLLCLQQLETLSKDDILHLLNVPAEDVKSDVISGVGTNSLSRLQNLLKKINAETSDALDLFPESEDVEMLLGDISNESEKSTEMASKKKMENISGNPAKMQMEIVELEFRARAIKALLRSQRSSEEEQTEPTV